MSKTTPCKVAWARFRYLRRLRPGHEMDRRRGPAQSHFRLVERDAYPLVRSPGHPAVAARMIARGHQPEAVGNTDRTGDFECSAGVRYIPDGAVDDAAVELDGSCLQYPVPGRCAMVLQNLKRFRCLGLCSLRRLSLQQPLGVLRCGLDGLVGQRRLDSCPGEPEADLAVLVIDGGPAVIRGRR